MESLEEHLSLKRVLADLVALPVMDEHFEPKLHVLKEQVEHHHKEEEEELFPEVKELLSTAEIEALGALMSAAEERLLAREPRDMVTDQTDAARALP